MSTQWPKRCATVIATNESYPPIYLWKAMVSCTLIYIAQPVMDWLCISCDMWPIIGLDVTHLIGTENMHTCCLLWPISCVKDTYLILSAHSTWKDTDIHVRAPSGCPIVPVLMRPTTRNATHTPVSPLIATISHTTMRRARNVMMMVVLSHIYHHSVGRLLVKVLIVRRLWLVISLISQA